MAKDGHHILDDGGVLAEQSYVASWYVPPRAGGARATLAARMPPQHREARRKNSIH